MLCVGDVSGQMPMWYVVALTVLFVPVGWSNSAVAPASQGVKKAETSLDLGEGCHEWRLRERRHKSR